MKTVTFARIQSSRDGVVLLQVTKLWTIWRTGWMRMVDVPPSEKIPATTERPTATRYAWSPASSLKRIATRLVGCSATAVPSHQTLSQPRSSMPETYTSPKMDVWGVNACRFRIQRKEARPRAVERSTDRGFVERRACMTRQLGVGYGEHRSTSIAQSPQRRLCTAQRPQGRPR